MPVSSHAIVKYAVIAALGVLPAAGCSMFGSSDDSSHKSKTSTMSHGRSVESGHGTIDYTATDDGQVAVRDTTHDAEVYSGRLARGQRIQVIPQDNRITVDGSVVSKIDLKKDDTHAIYFSADRSSSGRNHDDRSSSASHDRLPTSATRVGEGRNEEITYTAAHDGTMYVYDADASRVVGSAGIRDGQRFTFSPGRDRAMIDDNKVDLGDLDTRTNYRVYFDRQ